MSTLVVQLPEHRRLRAGSRRAGRRSAVAPRRREYIYVTSDDGLEVDAQGQARGGAAAGRPIVIAVVPEADVSWHRITLPKAPAARLRAALVGVLEEALLEDAETVHLAVAPLAVAGQPTWVAAVDKAWLAGRARRAPEGRRLRRPRRADGAGPTIRRAATSAPRPDRASARSKASSSPGPASTASPRCAWTAAWRARSCLRRHRSTTRWTAAPLAPRARPSAGSARRSTSCRPSSGCCRPARSLWNLRQFDLARRTRGARALRDWLRQAMSPAWRPVRFGLAAVRAGADRRPQPVGLASAERDRRAPQRDPGAGQDDLPARRRATSSATPRR